MKDELPESKRRNVATLIMMGNERKREIYIHAKTRGPLSLLYATSMREKEMKKVPAEFLYIFLSVIFFTYVNALLAFFPPHSLPFSNSALFKQNLHYLFRYYLSSTHFHLILTPQRYQWSVFHLLTYCLFINRYLILIKRHCKIGLTKIIESRLNETPVADRKSD